MRSLPDTRALCGEVIRKARKLREEGVTIQPGAGVLAALASFREVTTEELRRSETRMLEEAYNEGG